jgi:ribosome biogenesis protein MAK21
VAVFAAALADKDQKTQKPDLDSHSLIRFLDKFVYRNPKAADSTRGTSIMQPLHTTKDTGDIWLGSSRATGTTTSAINSAAFWNKKQENVAAEDVFFHEYFQQTAKESKRQTKASRAADEDEDGDEQEDEIWKALVSTQPEIDGHGDDSEGFDDLDDAEMASDDDDDDDIPLDLDDEDDISDDDMVDIEGDSDEGEELIAGAVATADGDDSEDAEGGEAKKEKDERRERRKKLRALPTFASVDDYAELLGQDEDEQFD